MKWGALAAELIDKLPIEKILVREPDHTQERKELKELIQSMNGKPASPPEEVKEESQELKTTTIPEEKEEPEPLPDRPRAHLTRHENVESAVTTEETIAYENRELGKALLSIEKHAAQGFKIAGKPCDCGQSRHLLFLETEAEDSMSMVDNPEIYQKILDFVGRLGPISTVEALNTHQYDQEYPKFSLEARDLRKELIGTLDPKALWPHPSGKLLTAKVTPEETQEETPEPVDESSVVDGEVVSEETSIVAERS